MEAAFALAISTMLIVYLAVTSAMSEAQAHEYRLAARDVHFENEVREMEAFFWREGLERRTSPDLLAQVSRDCGALIAAIGTRPLDQLSRQASRVEECWMVRGGLAGTIRTARHFPAPADLPDGARVIE
jgi:hypothetical protein